MSKKRLFKRNLCYNYDGRQNFYPGSDEIQGSKSDFGTWPHQKRLHSGEDQSFQFDFGEKKLSQLKRRVLRTFSNQVT